MTNKPIIIYQEDNTDPPIPPIVDSNNTVPSPPPVETSIWISYTYDNDTGEYIGTTHPEEVIASNPVAADINTEDTSNYYPEYETPSDFWSWY